MEDPAPLPEEVRGLHGDLRIVGRTKNPADSRLLSPRSPQLVEGSKAEDRRKGPFSKGKPVDRLGKATIE